MVHLLPFCPSEFVHLTHFEWHVYRGTVYHAWEFEIMKLIYTMNYKNAVSAASSFASVALSFKDGLWNSRACCPIAWHHTIKDTSVLTLDGSIINGVGALSQGNSALYGVTLSDSVEISIICPSWWADFCQYWDLTLSRSAVLWAKRQ